MALTFAVLDALAATPASVDDLARRLAAAPAHVAEELARLERRGYVQRLACAPSACGACALKTACGPDGATRWTRA